MILVRVRKACFAALRPRFNEEGQLIVDALKLVFPGLPFRLYQVGQFVLASIVYHSDFLMETLQETLGIFAYALFTVPEFLAKRPL